MRDSLSLQTLRLPDHSARLAWLAEHVPELPGTGIIYVLTKRDADRVAAWLRAHGVDAHAYYSGASGDGVDSDTYRRDLEIRLLRNEIKALVATSALGMGYDKPDLGFVVHYQAPGSIVHYYQQVGRAGRAIDRAIGLLMAGREDGDIQEYFRSTAFPDEAHVAQILAALDASDGLTDRDIESHVNLRYGQIAKVLKLLSVESPAPVIKDGQVWRRTAVQWTLDRQKVMRLSRQRELEWQEVQEYIETRGCLMQYLASKLDDPRSMPCGKCSNCLGRAVVTAQCSQAVVAAAGRFLKRSEFTLECNKQASAGGFPQYGLPRTIPKNLLAQPGRVLSQWGDGGWGEMVRADKRAGRFRDDLVVAVAEMIQMRWQPEPKPQWLTCVPSQRPGELVPDFARRLARRLGIEFVLAIAKARPNEPQKMQQNRYRQCMNLDGVFAIQAPVPAGPVLLVDDVVDSGWTLTVVAALLLRAGSGAVYPVALAQSSAGD
jgi:ATP-dependent DNA helicase RecQ